MAAAGYRPRSELDLGQLARLAALHERCCFGREVAGVEFLWRART